MNISQESKKSCLDCWCMQSNSVTTPVQAKEDCEASEAKFARPASALWPLGGMAPRPSDDLQHNMSESSSGPRARI